MAEDLRRFLADQPILARRSSVAEKTWRLCRRNPTVASLLGLLAGGFLVGFLAVTIAWRKADASRDLADTRLKDSRRNEGEAKVQRAAPRPALRRPAPRSTNTSTRLPTAKLSKPLGCNPSDAICSTRAWGSTRISSRSMPTTPACGNRRPTCSSARPRSTTEIAPGADAVAASEKAEALYRQLHGDLPEDDEVTAGLAEVLTGQGKNYEALGLLDPLVKAVLRIPAINDCCLWH